MHFFEFPLEKLGNFTAFSHGRLISRPAMVSILAWSESR